MEGGKLAWSVNLTGEYLECLFQLKDLCYFTQECSNFGVRLDPSCILES